LPKTRIIEFKDGEKISDSNPIAKGEKDDKKIKIKKTAMSFFTALYLSFNNIKTKKGRTILTSFASSIGIIGIALILSLSNGFKIEIDKFEKTTLSQAPIIVAQQSMNMQSMKNSGEDDETKNLEKYPKEEKVYIRKDILDLMIHQNNITDEYIKYVDNIDKTLLSGIAYERGTNLIIINKDDTGKYNYVQPVNSGESWTLLPTNPNKGENTIVDNMYDIIAGEINDEEIGLILQVDSKNRIFESTLDALGLSGKEVSFEDIMNVELKVVLNDDYYIENNGSFYPNQNLEELYNNPNSITVKVKAIIRGKEENEKFLNGSGFAYTNALTKLVIENNKNSKIVQKQREVDYNILTSAPFDETVTKNMILGYFGDDITPLAVYLYPKDFDSKQEIVDYLDAYNEDKNDVEKVEYTDMAGMISSLSGGIMDAITIVLIAFSSISLIVSSIMIGIITYISVLERTKEIGILRSLGARGKDVKRVFIAETFIIGITSGLLGILIARLLIIPINSVIYSMTSLKNVAKMSFSHAAILIAVSTTLTIIGGYIPSKIASKKNPVDALRTE